MIKDSIQLLVVDGGGTKTKAVLVGIGDTIIGEGKAGASNYHVVGEDAAKNEIVAAILSALFAAGIKPGIGTKVDKAVFALAGIDTSQDVKKTEKIVQDVIKTLSIEVGRLLVENDCLSALIGATQNKAGILLIVGTGSVVYANDGNNRIVRSGGWGHRVGDEGSGYWIGLHAIQSVFRMWDGRGEETLLASLVLEKFGFLNIEELYNWTYSDSYSIDDVGALAALVYQAHRMGDTVSKRILDAAADELVLLLVTVIKKANIEQDEIDLILQGGVILHNTYLQKQVLQKMQQSTTQFNIIIPHEEPIRNIIKRGLNLGNPG